MPGWTAFAGITIVVLVLLLVLSHLTQSAFPETPEPSDASDGSERPDTAASETPNATDSPDTSEVNAESSVSGIESAELADRGPVDEPVPYDSAAEQARRSSSADRTRAEAGDAVATRSETSRTDAARANPFRPDPADLSPGMLLANVALSQGVFAAVVIGAAIYTGIPADALGLEFSRSYLVSGLVIGTIFGIVLYAANEIGAAISTWVGLDHDEELREILGPDSTRGWVVLLTFVLPIIAVFEELLFRAALIGVFDAGFGISPWLLAVGSSIAFGLGHGMQGSVGVIVTGTLGFVLAAAFILTGSFLVVAVAHYLINAFEFVVHEGLGFDWAEVLESGG